MPQISAFKQVSAFLNFQKDTSKYVLQKKGIPLHHILPGANSLCEFKKNVQQI